MLTMSLYQKSGEPNSSPGSSDASGRSRRKMEGKAWTGVRREPSKRRTDMLREEERRTRWQRLEGKKRGERGGGEGGERS